MGAEAKCSRILAVELSDENLKPGTSKWIETCKDIRRALEDCGGFIANYNKLPLQLQNDFFTAAKQLFDLPTETKMQSISNKPFHNYFGQNQTIPLYESLPLYDPDNPDAAHHWFTNNIWPDGNESFCTNTHSMAKTLVELHDLVMKIIFDIYGIDDKCYESFVESSIKYVRLFKYRVPKQDETHVGIGPHSDKSIVTIIHQGRVNGLRIRSSDGDMIELDLAPSSFVILASDFLMAWSNDRISTCVHDVMVNASEPRYSIGLHTYSTGLVHVPKELVDDKHPLRYKPFDCFEYLRFFGGDHAKTIKVYCGI